MSVLNFVYAFLMLVIVFIFLKASIIAIITKTRNSEYKYQNNVYGNTNNFQISRRLPFLFVPGVKY